MSSEPNNKVAIIGAGSVGATLAYACLLRGVTRHLALYDVNKSKVQAECLDLNHGLQFVPTARLDGSDDIGVCENAAVVVVTAGSKQKLGQTRLDLAANNVAMCNRLIPDLLKVAPDCILLMVSNPVDILTYFALKISGLPRNRVMGSGTVLDSSRFRYLISRRCNVAVDNIHAYIAGEHGDSEIPLWSSASISNIALHEWAVPGHGKLTVRDRSEIFENVKEAGNQILKGKGVTNYAIGLATARILEAILKDENRVLPVSSLLNDFHGINDICMSVPCIVNRAGVEQMLPIPLNAAEIAGLQNSAQTLRDAIKPLLSPTAV